MPSDSLLVALVAVCGASALACLVLALRRLRRKRLIDDIPTSKAQGVFIGLSELRGTAESEAPLSSYLVGALCVQYDWRVEEQYTKTVVETYTDSRGHVHTRTRRVTQWTTVASGGEMPPFYLKDDTGMVRIVPSGANIENKTVLDVTCTPADPMYYEKGPAEAVPNSDHRRRFVEAAVPLHATLYVMGQARLRQDVVAAEIAQDEKAPMFMVSMRTEKQISSGEHRWSWFWAILGMAFALGCAVLVNARGPDGYVGRWELYVLASAASLLAMVLGWIWTVYNSLIDLRQRVRQAWSQVDVQLKRRADLIPNLANAVEAYRSHERGVQELVTQLRGQLAATPPGMAGAEFAGLAPAIRITVERYPELRASEVFLKLQQELVDAEQRIALARDYFNQITTAYNTRRLIVPDRFVAALARLRPQSLLVASDFERAPVQVRLAD